MNTATISLYLTDTQIEQCDESRVELKSNGNAAMREFYIGTRLDNQTPLVGLTLNVEEAKALAESLQIFIEATG